MFRFKCTCCNGWHEGMPTFGADAPLYLYGIPEEERQRRCVLKSDTCVIDDKLFFVRGCIEIPVSGTSEPFIWGVWASLSAQSFEDFVACFDAPRRAHIGPFFGWLSCRIAALSEHREFEDARSSAGRRGTPVHRVGTY